MQEGKHEMRLRAQASKAVRVGEQTRTVSVDLEAEEELEESQVQLCLGAQEVLGRRLLSVRASGSMVV